MPGQSGEAGEATGMREHCREAMQFEHRGDAASEQGEQVAA
jgi:hypothetical protein